MVITDLVYEQIRSHIAAHAPERGGALYGPRAFPLVTHFEFDPEGLTSSTSYVPSTRLIGNVPRVERQTGLQFKGIVHSHPDGFVRPSGGDEQTVGSFFRMNPHIAAMALPIVQRQRGDAPFMRWYRAERREDRRARFGRLPYVPITSSEVTTGSVQVLDEEFHVLPISQHVERVIALLREFGVALSSSGVLQALQVQNAELVGLVAESGQGHEFMYFVSIDYPVMPPLVLCQVGGTTEQLRILWDGLGETDAALKLIARGLYHRWRDSPLLPTGPPPHPEQPRAAQPGESTAGDDFVPYQPQTLPSH